MPDEVKVASEEFILPGISLEPPAKQAKKLIEMSRKSPDLWIENVLGCKLTIQERELVNLVAQNARVVVKSCTGSGKTWTAARLALWFICNYQPSIVLTTAKTFRQVENEIWKEIWVAYKGAKFPLGGRLLATRLDMAKDWFALGFSTEQAENVLGIHADNILIIIDEAPAIPDEVYNAIETPMSTGYAKLLLLGNPTQPIGRYRDTFDSPLFKQFTISAFDTPNFSAFGITLEDIRDGSWRQKIGIGQWQIDNGEWLHLLPWPKLINPLWVSQMREEWGEGSFSFQVYVMGNFPTKGANNLFNLEEVEAAINRKVNDEGELMAALDVSRYGDCESVYGLRRGDRLLRMEIWGHEGIHYTTGRVARHLRLDNAARIHIDAGGIGVDDCEILEKEGFVVNRVLSNTPAVDNERFANRRAELFWLLSKRFTDGTISIPNDRKLISQLTDIRYTFQNGKMIMESKEMMRSRGSKSPDRADMLALLFYPAGEELDDNEGPPVWTKW